MPHVTFIHGIANKPPADVLLEDWKHNLKYGGLNLDTRGVGASMAYWADVMYASPEESTASYESADGDCGTSAGDDDNAWIDALPESERKWVSEMVETLGLGAPSPGGDDFTPDPPQGEGFEGTGQARFEAVPLPWFIKRRLMKRLLRDVHHYLFNDVSEPRDGERYQVRDHIRQLFIDQLKEDAAGNNGGAHVVLSHSMGTVIAYDCLKNVPDCPSIDGLMTVGSPLGISEVHDNFDPEYQKEDAFPSARVSGGWVNVYDRLDPVAFDARIANDYQKGGVKVVNDIQVRNQGSWRHSSWKYFGQEDLCHHLAELLGVS